MQYVEAIKAAIVLLSFILKLVEKQKDGDPETNELFGKITEVISALKK